MWTMLVAGGALLLPAIIFGPSRLYGLLAANKLCEGTVTAIQPSGTSDSAFPKLYNIELNTDEQEMQMFSSHDQKWSLVVKGERVRARLVPSPPWSACGSLWQDAALLGIYRNPQEARTPAQRPASQSKSRPLVSSTSAAASFLLMAMFVRSLRRRRGQMTGDRVQMEIRP